MKKLFFIFLMFATVCFSQNRFSYVLQKFNTINDDSARVDSINKYCWMNSTKDVYLSEELLKENLKLAKQINYRKGIAKIYVLLGNIYLQKKDFQKAIEYYQQGLIVREALSDKSGVAAIYGNIGNAFYLLKQYDKALEYQEKSLHIFNELEKETKNGEYWFDIAECEISIGKILIEQNNYVEAEKRFLKTDGFADQFGGEKNKKFSIATLKNLMIQLAPLDLLSQKKYFENSLLSWKKDNEQTDDITLIGIKFV